MTCENSVRPKFTVALPIGKIGKIIADSSNGVQIDTK
jgi:hypothetical protein